MAEWGQMPAGFSVAVGLVFQVLEADHVTLGQIFDAAGEVEGPEGAPQLRRSSRLSRQIQDSANVWRLVVAIRWNGNYTATFQKAVFHLHLLSSFNHKAETYRLYRWALLHKWPECWTSPSPGQTYPTASVTGMPSAV